MTKAHRKYPKLDTMDKLNIGHTNIAYIFKSHLKTINHFNNRIFNY